MQKALGQAIIENVSGASGMIAAAKVAQAFPVQLSLTG
jgi:tripartite-type tricarboxylate transporter receptor subunit TctC